MGGCPRRGSLTAVAPKRRYGAPRRRKAAFRWWCHDAPIKDRSVSVGLTPADDSVNKMDERLTPEPRPGFRRKNDEFKLGQRPSGTTRGDLLLANIHVANDRPFTPP